MMRLPFGLPDENLVQFTLGLTWTFLLFESFTISFVGILYNDTSGGAVG
jgi:hypothetical protein